MDLKTQVYFVEVDEGSRMYHRPLDVAEGVVDIAEKRGAPVRVPEARDGKRLVMHMVVERKSPDGQRYVEVLIGYTDRSVGEPNVFDPETRIYLNRIGAAGSAADRPERLKIRRTDAIFTPLGKPARRLMPEDAVGEVIYRRTPHFEVADDARSYVFSPRLGAGEFLEPSSYLTKIQSAYNQVVDDWECGLATEEGETPLDICFSRLRSMPLAGSTILSRIQALTEYRQNGYITYKELGQFVEDKDVAVVLQSKGEDETVEATHDWNNDNVETLVCARLEAELPTAMFNRGIFQWGFRMVFDGVGVSVSFFNLNAEWNQSDDLTTVTQELERLLIDITAPYLDELSGLEVNGSVVGDSRYEITADEGETRIYMAPTYMDSMYSSYLSSDHVVFNQTAEAVEESLADLGLPIITKH